MSRTACALSLALLVACGGAQGGGGPKTPTPASVAWSDADAAVPTTSADPSWGDRDAPVTIVEFADFQCHFCGVVAPTLDALRAAYGPHTLRVVWKNLPLARLHPMAREAAEAAEGVLELAGKDAFWRFHDDAMKNQTALARPRFVAWARAAGVPDAAQFEARLARHDFAGKVEEDLALARDIGLGGTPSFFVNGVFINGAKPIERFKRTIDRELAKANVAIAKGTPKDKVYVAMSQQNAANPPPPDPDDEEEEEDTRTVWRVPSAGPARGPSTALVTIVEFGDFEDKYTRRAEETLRGLSAKYGDALRIVWRSEPLPHHLHAPLAAALAAEARAEKGDSGFWAAHDELLAAPALDEAELRRIADAVGLDPDKTKAALESGAQQPALDADLDVMDDFDAYATPHFFINGRRLVGAHPPHDFVRIIDQELATARAMVAKGTAADRVYEERIAGGVPPAEPEAREMPAPPTDAPSRGKKDAKVVVEIFSDFECPFCARAEPTMKELELRYGDRVRLVWRNLPLTIHEHAEVAAEGALEAYEQKGDLGFWALHDRIFSHQDELARDTLDGWARDVGLDMEKWARALEGHAHKARIDVDTAAAEAADLHGTPAFLVMPAAGGRAYVIRGARPFVRFRKIVERALREVD